MCCTHTISPSSLNPHERVTIICFTSEERGEHFLGLCQGHIASGRQCQISAQECLTPQPLLLLPGCTTSQGVQVARRGSEERGAGISAVCHAQG